LNQPIFERTTFAQYVLAEGVTSPSGPLAALTYHAATKKSLYLDAWYNQPLDPQAQWTKENPDLGKSILVPSAVRGLTLGV
jgi:hypothetical protein